MTIEEIKRRLEEIPPDLAEALRPILDFWEKQKAQRSRGGKRRQALHGPPSPEAQARATAAATLARIARAKARRAAAAAEKPYPDGDEPI